MSLRVFKWCLISKCLAGLAAYGFSHQVTIGAEIKPKDGLRLLQRLGATFEAGVSSEGLQAYARHFTRLDLDQDGAHSKEEYIEKGVYLTARARQGIFQAADSDGDDSVSRAEYIMNRIITDEAKGLIQAMDADENGTVDRAEFVAKAGKKLSGTALAERVFDAWDRNGDSRIIVPEYLRQWGQWARVGDLSPEERLARAGFTGGARSAARPNFVFILVDDLGKEDLGIEGSRFYETPHIDALGRRSLRFERGYSACQVCSPSRAAIQSGKSPARVKITDYISVRGGNQPEQWGRNTPLLPANYQPELSLDEVTIAEALKEGGYHTFFAGKWHLGADGFTPREQGYDENQGGYHYGTPPGGYHSPYNNPKLTDDEPGTELPIRLGRETADFIKRKAAAEEPFFAMLSFYSVHGPIQCSKTRFEKFQAKAEAMGLTKRTEPRFLFDRTQEVRQVQDHPIYAGMMAALDDSVGLVLEQLKASGVADNTVVIFTSDNGGVSSGDGYATACLPMRGGKGRQWEGGIRQPYYIAWPGVTDNGGSHEVLATGMDFYPTLLEIAGLDARPSQHRDGVSLVPVLRGKTIPERPLFWHYPHYGNQGGEPSGMMMEKDWKLIEYFEDGRRELYDLSVDRGEQDNLASKHPERVKRMAAALKAWQSEVGAVFPTKNPKFDGEKRTAQRERMAKGNPNREKQHAAFMDAQYTPRGGWWDQRKRR